MSLLQLRQDSVHEHDASSEGEDLAKGSGYMLWTLMLSFVLLTVGISLFLMYARKPPVAAGEVTQLWAHAVHTLNTPNDANGNPTPGEVFDQVLVFAQVHVRNQSDQPIILVDLLTNADLDDGPHSSYAAGPTDYDRIFIAYPELAGLRSKALVRDTVVQPEQVLDGMIVSAFHVSKDQWAKRKNLTFTLKWKNHPDLVLTPKVDVTEQ